MYGRRRIYSATPNIDLAVSWEKKVLNLNKSKWLEANFKAINFN